MVCFCWTSVSEEKEKRKEDAPKEDNVPKKKSVAAKKKRKAEGKPGPEKKRNSKLAAKLVEVKKIVRDDDDTDTEDDEKPKFDPFADFSDDLSEIYSPPPIDIAPIPKDNK